MKEYKIINLLTGMITIVVAKSIFSAIKKGQEYFSEPNRNTTPVQIMYDA